MSDKSMNLVENHPLNRKAKELVVKEQFPIPQISPLLALNVLLQNEIDLKVVAYLDLEEVYYSVVLMDLERNGLPSWWKGSELALLNEMRKRCIHPELNPKWRGNVLYPFLIPDCLSPEKPLDLRRFRNQLAYALLLIDLEQAEEERNSI
ncbi:MAG: hypothetical protein ACFFCW_19000 [Candidatus Hodarchaeota archaeon]